MKKKNLKKLTLQKKAIATLDATTGGIVNLDQSGHPGSICEPRSLCNTQCMTWCELTICHVNCQLTRNDDICTIVNPAPINL
ncbi:hypothetical protein [Kordia jejudonensis]|uniref:hypothetical protein n=1 Tax=Kordia jejudonensis TaxID=1348245 RepID=UPI00062906B2|nr:hypothetical protein [Kordia jejudonensis]